MLPGLEEKYNLVTETITKTRDAYRKPEYQEFGLPIAPAIMLGDELIIQGGPISNEKLKSAIHRQLVNE